MNWSLGTPKQNWLNTVTAALPALGPVAEQMVGENAGDDAGRSVSAAGDVNGDGFDDVIVGAPFGSQR